MREIIIGLRQNWLAVEASRLEFLKRRYDNE